MKKNDQILLMLTNVLKPFDINGEVALDGDMINIGNSGLAICIPEDEYGRYDFQGASPVSATRDCPEDVDIIDLASLPADASPAAIARWAARLLFEDQIHNSICDTEMYIGHLEENEMIQQMDDEHSESLQRG